MSKSYAGGAQPPLNPPTNSASKSYATRLAGLAALRCKGRMFETDRKGDMHMISTLIIRCLSALEKEALAAPAKTAVKKSTKYAPTNPVVLAALRALAGPTAAPRLPPTTAAAIVIADAEAVRLRLWEDCTNGRLDAERSRAYAVHTLNELSGYCAIFARCDAYAAAHKQLAAAISKLRETMDGVGLSGLDSWSAADKHVAVDQKTALADG